MDGNSDGPTSTPPRYGRCAHRASPRRFDPLPGREAGQRTLQLDRVEAGDVPYMGTSRLIRYTKSNAKSFHPNQFLDLIGYDNWVQNDECACAYIHGAISANEHLALGSQALTKDAAALWALLEARHKDDGPVTQVSLIREAMGLRATADDFTTAPHHSLAE